MKRSAKRAKSDPKRKKPPTDTAKISAQRQKEIVVQVQKLAEPLCMAEQLELVHVEYQREARGRILRLYIDREGGVSLKDCVNVSRQMDDILDVYLEDIGPYSLEVTSPGTDRPLSKKQDFEKFIGSRVKIKTHRPVNGQKNFSGRLARISGEMVTLATAQKTIVIDYQDIVKARLVHDNGEY